MTKPIKIGVGIFVVVVLAGYFGINFATEYVLPYSPIRPGRCTDDGGVLTPSAAGLIWKSFDVTVEDTIQLRGWFVDSKLKPARGTIFLLHGIASCKSTMIPTADLLTSSGFNCVLYDSRANGESGGINCTFGYFEKDDLSAFIDSAQSRFPDSGPYAVFGNSLGAAVAIQAMERDRRLVCGVVESPFANLRDVIHDYFARMFLIRINSIPDRALTFTEKIAHFPIDGVQPAVSAKRVTQPVMVIHGLEDKHISPSYGKLVFDNLRSREKEWLPIPTGDHYNLRKVGGEEYKRKIVEFFQHHLLAAT
ncbi:MAG: alpha/beta fold hydrolase [Ignavibacteriae bacterium]|nr:alpha/beta fold hydrolase [Ignavibacteriota bacterium]